MPQKKSGMKNKGKDTQVAKLARQVSALTSRVGYPERYDTSVDGRSTFGAFNTSIGAQAAFVANITPPTLHSNYDNIGGVGGRKGKAINLKSFQLRLRVSSDVQRMNGGRVDVYMVRQPVDRIDLTTLGSGSAPGGIDSFLERDPWVSGTQGYPCYTTQSLRQMENANYGKFRVIAKRTINFPMEAIGSVSAVGVKNVDIFKKVNFPIEYALDDNTDIDAVKNSIHLIAVCDGGNAANQTGFLLQYNCKYFYTDN